MTTQFLSQFTISACSNLEAILRIRGDDDISAFLNGVTIGSGTQPYTVYYFKITLICGVNTLISQVYNIATGSGIIFCIVQCSSDQFINAAIQCQACPTGCSSCQSSLICKSCLPGYLLNGSALCQAYPTGCATCLSLTVCLVCQVNYFLNATDLCQPCPTGCSVCFSSTSCSVCTSGFYLSLTSCITSCPLRFYPSPQNLKCVTCPYDCLTCNATMRCLTCEPTDGRLLDPITGRCVPLEGYL